MPDWIWTRLWILGLSKGIVDCGYRAKGEGSRLRLRHSYRLFNRLSTGMRKNVDMLTAVGEPSLVWWDARRVEMDCPPRQNLSWRGSCQFFR